MACDVETRKLRDRERIKKRTAGRRARGLCPRCGDCPPADGLSVCGSCAGKRRLAGRARDARLRAEGKPRRDPQRAKAYERKRSRRRTEDRIARGICTRCGAQPPEDGRRLCAGCGEKRRAADRKRYAEASARGEPYGLSGAPDKPYYPELGFIPSDVAEVPCYALSRHIDSGLVPNIIVRLASFSI